MGLVGMLIERLLVRPILGYPQFAIVMATIGLGYFLRSAAGMIWGTDDLKIDNPFATGAIRIDDLMLAHDKLSVIVATVILARGRELLGLRRERAAPSPILEEQDDV